MPANGPYGDPYAGIEQRWVGGGDSLVGPPTCSDWKEAEVARLRRLLYIVATAPTMRESGDVVNVRLTGAMIRDIRRLA